MFKTGFQVSLIGLTDHFSVPFDEEDVFFNVFNLPLDSSASLSQALGTNAWHDLEMDWSCDRRVLQGLVDSHQVLTLEQNRTCQNFGLSYLRLRSVAKSDQDAGFLIDSVEVGRTSDSR
jgi:hypothetical protein